MNTLRPRSVLGLGCALLLPLLGGCSSLFKPQADATRFYVLSASAAALTATNPAQGATIGLCRIELPAYLRTPAVVLRPGGTEVRHAPAARWAEPLDQGIGRVLRESLRAQPGVRSVVAYPAPRAATPDYEVSIAVLACEAVETRDGQQARFAATWEIRSTADGGRLVATGTFEIQPPDRPAGDMADLTTALGGAVAELGRVLASMLPK